MEELELARETTGSGGDELGQLGTIERDFPFSFDCFDGLTECEMGLGRARLGNTGILLIKHTASGVSGWQRVAAMGEGERGTVMMNSRVDDTKLNLEREAVRVGW